jgi:hypothetical protein
MSEDRAPISQGQSYQAIGEFWDSHDLTEFWEQTKPAEFEVDARFAATYYPLENGLAAKLRFLAEQHGISAETLLNLWVQEKVAEASLAK